MKENIKIRVASTEDAGELLEIYKPYVEYTAITFEYEVPDIEEFTNRIKNTKKTYPYLVAEYQGEILGYAYAGAFKERAAYDWAVETSIYVRQNQKRMGVGSLLYEKLEEILKNEEKYKNSSMQKKKEVFKEIHNMLGGNVKLLISGAAALDKTIEEKYRLLGLNLVQGYGLTETSPVVAVGTNKNYKLGSIGKTVPSVEAKLVDVNDDGIGELVVRGSSVMLGYYENEKVNKKSLQDGWFYTGDLAKIDEEGYIFMCGRKKSVIVLKNGKNIFPEEMENLVNKIEGIRESFIFGKIQSNDENNIKINVKIVFDRDVMKDVYKVEEDEDIYKVLSKKIKEVNQTMPSYKAIRGMILTEEPLIKTTTNKIKRQENLDAIRKLKD